MKKILGVFVSVMFLLVPFAVATPALAAHNADGLAGYWNFDDDTANPTLDSSGHSNDGAISGGAAYTAAGIAPVPGNQNALTFDGGDDYVTVANDSELDMTGAYSLSAWVNVTDVPVGTYRPIAFRGATNANDIEVYVQHTSGDLIVAHNRGNAGTFDYVGFDNPTVGSLFHLVVTYDGTDVRAYYDGVAAAVVQGTTAVTAPLDTNKGWWLGKVDHSAFGGINLFKGLLDEVRIYGTALDADEIAALGDYSNFTVDSDDPAEAFNPVGTDHTVTVTVDPALAGIPVLFEISGPNSAESDTVITDGDGDAGFTYTGAAEGIDTITACIDLDNSGTCDEGESQAEVTKTWFLQYFATGGGSIKEAKKVTWTFGGTVGFDLDMNPVGNFQIVNHVAKKSCHLDEFSFLEFDGDATESPVSEKDIATFVGSGWCSDGSTVEDVTVTIHDEAEPGAGADTISVSDDDLGTVVTKTLAGGNFQVHPPEE